ncbi:hypothetical protein B5M42_011720 [Paenibacillus athensensis]|uniref:hypothetical protein n=1 Tax=Paenibacillus athensensis TaxID=1967502 RepID=UPI0010702C52|nr:hypothetical protein [Paenibacillus athensensis]MCD1259498.1 hypothetical protein [Paenibacillus athensensis]
MEHIWGPMFDFKFNGLVWNGYFEAGHAGGPDPSCSEFAFERVGRKLLVQVDEPPRWQHDTGLFDRDAQLLRSNRLLLEGWLPLRFSWQQLWRRPYECRELLYKAVLGSAKPGSAHTAWCWRERPAEYGALSPDELELWHKRKAVVLELAASRRGRVRPREVAAIFNISSRVAAEWLVRFTLEGHLSAIAGPSQITVFVLPELNGTAP